MTPEETEGLAGMLPDVRREIERALRSLPRDLEFPPAGPRGRAVLGLTLAPLTDQLASYFGVNGGVLVSAVEPGSPAAQAGLRAGDVITAIEGRDVRTVSDVAANVRTAIGTMMDVTVVRDREALTVTVNVPERGMQRRQIPV